MFSCTVTGAADHPIIQLSGSLTLEHCREIHSELLAHLPKNGSVTLDLGETDKSDLSFVQILCALLREPNTTTIFANLPAHLFETAATLGADSLIKEISSRTEENV
jgi:anti-anti-sigma regulatory factor